eukprot:Nk52_evm71s207 gene=Nk52_evmTU71s207
MSSPRSVLCVDVGKNMGEMAFGLPTVTKFELLRQTLLATLGARFGMGRKTEKLIVVSFGDDESANSYFDENGACRGIRVVANDFATAFEVYNRTERTLKLGSESGDFMDAIAVCLEEVQKEPKTKKEQFDIYVMTDFNGASCLETESRKEFTKFLESNRCRLIFFGVGVNERNNGTQMKNIDFVTSWSKASEAVSLRIARSELEVLSFFAKRSSKPSSSEFRMYFSEDFFIHVCLKNMRGLNVKISTREVEISSNLPVQKETVYFRADDEDKMFIPKEKLIQGYTYGKSLIPLSKVDEEYLKWSEPASLKIIAIARVCNIKHSYLMDATYLVHTYKVPDKKGKKKKNDSSEHLEWRTSEVIFSALLDILISDHLCMIGRLVIRSAPKLGVLFPHRQGACTYLQFVETAYADDVREFAFSSLPKLNESSRDSKSKSEFGVAEMEAMDEFIDSMDLDVAGKATEDPDVLVTPENVLDPKGVMQNQNILMRYEHDLKTLVHLNPLFRKGVRPSSDIVSASTEYLTRIKDLFKLSSGGANRNSGESRKHDLNFAVGTLGESSGSKRMKIDDERSVDFSLGQEFREEGLEIGTLDPVGDYAKLLGRKDTDWTKDANEMMINTIKSFILDGGFGHRYYSRACECIKALREECVERWEAATYNGFLTQMKNDCENGDHHKFWLLLCDESITLISNDENPDDDGTVAKDVAEMFIATKSDSVRDTREASEELPIDDDLLNIL